MKKLCLCYAAFLLAVLLLMTAVDHWTGFYKTPSDKPIPNAVTEGWVNEP